MTFEREKPRRIDKGEWNDGGTTWEFWNSNVEPNPKLCSAIGLVAITNLDTNSIVLTENDRGWETIAGGIDPGETPEEALRREALEEGGFVVVRQKIYGHRKIVNKVMNDEARRKGYKPLAYMPYYYAFADEKLRDPTGDEIIDSGVFSMDKKKDRAKLKPAELLLVQEGLRAAHRARENA